MAQKPLLHPQRCFCAMFIFGLLPCAAHFLGRHFEEAAKPKVQNTFHAPQFLRRSARSFCSLAQILLRPCAPYAKNVCPAQKKCGREHFFALPILCAAFLLCFWRFRMFSFIVFLLPFYILHKCIHFRSICTGFTSTFWPVGLSACLVSMHNFFCLGSFVLTVARFLHHKFQQNMHVFLISSHFPLFLCRLQFVMIMALNEAAGCQAARYMNILGGLKQ